MSKKDEALKLAREALENGKRVRNAEGGTKYQPDLEDKALTAIREAQAEQQASGLNPLWIATHPDGLTTPQPAQQEIKAAEAGGYSIGFGEGYQAGKDAAQQAQPAQQEPVAVVEAVVPHLESILVKHILDAPFPRVGDFIYTSPPAQQEPVGEITAEDMGRPFNAIRIGTHFYKEVPPVGTKLYTSPPASKPWLGLKLADKNAIVRKAELRMEKDQNLSWRVALIEETEAKLLEKNAAQRKPLTVMEKEIIWKKHKRTLGGWDHGGTEVIDDNAFDDVVRAIEAAHGIKGDAMLKAREGGAA